MQESCIAWLRTKHPDLVAFHVNNNARNACEGARLKRLGVLAGVPDVFIARSSPIYLGLWVEFKSGGKKPTAAQLAIQGALTMEGYAVIVCNSAERFRVAVTRYLSGSEEL